MSGESFPATPSAAKPEGSPFQEATEARALTAEELRAAQAGPHFYEASEARPLTKEEIQDASENFNEFKAKEFPLDIPITPLRNEHIVQPEDQGIDDQQRIEEIRARLDKIPIIKGGETMPIPAHEPEEEIPVTPLRNERVVPRGNRAQNGQNAAGEQEHQGRNGNENNQNNQENRDNNQRANPDTLPRVAEPQAEGQNEIPVTPLRNEREVPHEAAANENDHHRTSSLGKDVGTYGGAAIGAGLLAGLVATHPAAAFYDYLGIQFIKQFFFDGGWRSVVNSSPIAKIFGFSIPEKKGGKKPKASSDHGGGHGGGHANDNEHGGGHGHANDNDHGGHGGDHGHGAAAGGHGH